MAKTKLIGIYQNLSEDKKMILRLKDTSYRKINLFVGKKNNNIKSADFRKLIDNIIRNEIVYYVDDNYSNIFTMFVGCKEFHKSLGCCIIYIFVLKI